MWSVNTTSKEKLKKKYAENESRKLVPDHFLFFEKGLY